MTKKEAIIILDSLHLIGCGRNQHENDLKINLALDMAIEALQDIPKRGEWIDKGWKGDWQFETDGRGNCWHEYECSECGFHSKGSKSNFCPHCGARMKGGDEE